MTELISSSSGDVFEFGLANTPVTSNPNHITLPLMIPQHNYILAVNSKNRTKKLQSQGWYFKKAAQGLRNAHAHSNSTEIR